MVRPNLRSIFAGAPRASPRDPGARRSPAAPGPRAPTVRRRRSMSTALLHGYAIRSQTPVSTASTFYPGYARSWTRRPPRGPCTPRSGRPDTCRAPLLAPVVYPCREPSPRPKPELFWHLEHRNRPSPARRRHEKEFSGDPRRRR